MLVIHKVQSVTEDIEMKQGETTVKEAASPQSPPYLLIFQSLPGMFEELELNPHP